ncbi:hypothetical protein MIR68_006605 [Amoeboaphelidium protococcarum]|nr:hypothetical protein MIR68_006605 [Amoeboaphelidium protococcarum]
MESLYEWFSQNGAWYDTEAIEFISDSGQCGVFARRDLNQDEVVCKINKYAVISPKTSDLRRVFDTEDIHGVIRLAVVLMYEFSLGEQSRYYAYLQSLPQMEANLPILWTQDFVAQYGREYQLALDALQCSELNNDKLHGERRSLLQDYEQIVEPLFKKYPKYFKCRKYFNFQQFVRCSSLVSSRCFYVDDHLQDCMVPMADLFNHKSAAENVHLETENVRLSKVYNHSSNIIDMRIVRPVQKGCEVFNTYGDKDNVQLFCNYGFTERDNPFDAVTIRLSDVMLLDGAQYEQTLSQFCDDDDSVVRVKSDGTLKLSKKVRNAIAQCDQVLSQYSVDVDQMLMAYITRKCDQMSLQMHKFDQMDSTLINGPPLLFVHNLLNSHHLILLKYLQRLRQS